MLCSAARRGRGGRARPGFCRPAGAPAGPAPPPSRRRTRRRLRAQPPALTAAPLYSIKQGRETLAAALLRGAIYPGLAARLGAAHGAIAARVSRQAVGAKAWAALGAVSDASANVADMMEDHVLYLVSIGWGGTAFV